MSERREEEKGETGEEVGIWATDDFPFLGFPLLFRGSILSLTELKDKAIRVFVCLLSVLYCDVCIIHGEIDV